MQMSVIIVNYNVKYFLEQCLLSLTNALKNIEAEIIVVDNASTDDSITYLAPKFPSVSWIDSTTNLGFSKANNLALAQAKGQYTLFLNPDTIVNKHAIQTCLHYLDQHPQVGAVGVKLIDGSGQFLPESKRGFPTPANAFYKFSGLAKIFPTILPFAGYYLGNINKEDTQPIDILPGAFMCCRTDIIKALNGFDEHFFMYGEDIDLCYRIKQRSYDIVYLGNAAIVHFKGESTQKNSLQYIQRFYGAMQLFVNKHYSTATRSWFNSIIKAAILFKAIFAGMSKLIKVIGLPIIDFLLCLWVFEYTKDWWADQFRNGLAFENTYLNYVIILLAASFSIAGFFNGLYEPVEKPFRYFLRATGAALFIIAIYALLPEQVRFSRGVVVLSAAIIVLLTGFTRILFIILKWINLLELHTKKTILVTGQKHLPQAEAFLQQSGLYAAIVGKVIFPKNPSTEEISGLFKTAHFLHAERIIFNLSDIDSAIAIQCMQKEPKQMQYHFFHHQSNTIIHSASKNITGAAITATGVLQLQYPYQQRMKRLVDVVTAVLFLILLPIHYILKKNSSSFILNCLQVLIGLKTWIGYYSQSKDLPKLKVGIIGCTGVRIEQINKHPAIQIQNLDFLYAKDYDWLTDVKIIFANYNKL